MAIRYGATVVGQIILDWDAGLNGLKPSNYLLAPVWPPNQRQQKKPGTRVPGFFIL